MVEREERISTPSLVCRHEEKETRQAEWTNLDPLSLSGVCAIRRRRKRALSLRFGLRRCPRIEDERSPPRKVSHLPSKRIRCQRSFVERATRRKRSASEAWEGLKRRNEGWRVAEVVPLLSPRFPFLLSESHTKTSRDHVFLYSAHIYPPSDVLYHSPLGYNSVDKLGRRDVEGRAAKRKRTTKD